MRLNLILLIGSVGYLGLCLFILPYIDRWMKQHIELTLIIMFLCVVIALYDHFKNGPINKRRTPRP